MPVGHVLEHELRCNLDGGRASQQPQSRREWGEDAASKRRCARHSSSSSAAMAVAVAARRCWSLREEMVGKPRQA